MCAHRVLCRKFNYQLLCEAFLDIIGIFGSAQPVSESTSWFKYIIIFQTCQSLEPLASLLGKMDMCAH